MTKADREQLIAILSNFETRSSKDIQFLMRMAFEASKTHKSFDDWFAYVKRELLDL